MRYQYLLMFNSKTIGILIESNQIILCQNFFKYLTKNRIKNINTLNNQIVKLNVGINATKINQKNIDKVENKIKIDSYYSIIKTVILEDKEKMVKLLYEIFKRKKLAKTVILVIQTFIFDINDHILDIFNFINNNDKFTFNNKYFFNQLVN